jgi:hypothetical protein
MFIVKNTSNDSNLLEKILLFLEVNTSLDFLAGYLMRTYKYNCRITTFVIPSRLFRREPNLIIFEDKVGSRIGRVTTFVIPSRLF